jgi:hypothetical protein
MKKKHEEIVQNAKKFAEQSYDMLRMGQFPDFMLNMQQQGFQVFTNQFFLYLKTKITNRVYREWAALHREIKFMRSEGYIKGYSNTKIDSWRINN